MGKEKESSGKMAGKFTDRFESVGAMWIGQRATSIRIEKDVSAGTRLVAFKNTRKIQDKHPDMGIYIDKKSDGND